MWPKDLKSVALFSLLLWGGQVNSTKPLPDAGGFLPARSCPFSCWRGASQVRVCVFCVRARAARSCKSHHLLAEHVLVPLELTGSQLYSNKQTHIPKTSVGSCSFQLWQSFPFFHPDPNTASVTDDKCSSQGETSV